MLKQIVVSLLLLTALGQTVDYKQIIDSFSNDTLNQDGYQTVPVDTLNGTYAYVRDIIEQTFPTLSSWLLVDAKFKFDNSTLQTLYLYTFVELLQTSKSNVTSEVVITDIRTVPVLGQENSTYFVVFDGSKVVSSYNINRKNPDIYIKDRPVLGGFQQGDITSLDQLETQALSFTLKSDPKLKNWTLVSLRTQVVAGERICFTFKENNSTKTQEYCVVCQPWLNNFMQLTLPNGTIITSGGNSTTTQSNTSSSSSASPPSSSPTPSTITQLKTSSSTSSPPPPPPSNLPRVGSSPPSVGSGAPSVGTAPPPSSSHGTRFLQVNE